MCSGEIKKLVNYLSNNYAALKNCTCKEVSGLSPIDFTHTVVLICGGKRKTIKVSQELVQDISRKGISKIPSHRLNKVVKSLLPKD